MLITVPQKVSIAAHDSLCKEHIFYGELRQPCSSTAEKIALVLPHVFLAK
jgi:hypothetical protein